MNLSRIMIIIIIIYESINLYLYKVLIESFKTKTALVRNSRFSEKRKNQTSDDHCFYEIMLYF